MIPRTDRQRRRMFDDARKALATGDFDGAITGFEQVLARNDADANAWFNLGLAYKLRGDWPNAARCNHRAAGLDPSMLEASWNLGVAATAQRDWATARSAWRNIGIDAGSGDGPPDLRLGPSPIRLLNGEVVWGDRVDPCRARLANVPLPESAHRWGDVVLHDVVPNGERRGWGKTWAVFDELIRMDEGEFPTLVCELIIPAEADQAALQDAFGGHDLGIEDWTSSVRWLCRTCSLGSPHEHTRSGGVVPVWLATRRYGFAGPDDEIGERLTDWASRGAGRSFGPFTPTA